VQGKARVMGHLHVHRMHGGRKQGYQAAYSQKFVRKQVQHEKKSFLKIKTDDKFVI